MESFVVVGREPYIVLEVPKLEHTKTHIMICGGW